MGLQWDKPSTNWCRISSIHSITLVKNRVRTMLLTDGAACYPPFARKQNLLHESVRRKCGEFVKHVQRGRSTIKCHTGTMLRGPAAKKNHPQPLWVPSTKMSCCMPRCGNGDSLTST